MVRSHYFGAVNSSNQLLLAPYTILLGLLLLLHIPSFVFCQAYIDPVKVQFSQGLNQRFQDPLEPAAYSNLKVDILTPIQINKNHALVTGAILEHHRISLNRDESPCHVHEWMLKLGWSGQVNSNWRALVLALPKHSATQSSRDFKNGLQIGGVLLMNRKWSPNLQFKAGLYANSDLFGPMLVPIIGGYWKTEHFEFSAALPMNARASYQMGAHFGMGAQFQGINKSYHHGTSQYVEMINNEAGVFINYTLGSLIFECAINHSLARSYNLYPNSERMNLALSFIKIGDHRTSMNQPFSDGALISFKANYRLPIQ